MGQLSGSTFGFGGLPGGVDQAIVGGLGPPVTARVVTAGPGRASRDAVPAECGPGERLFGQIFPDIGDEPISGINFRITPVVVPGPFAGVDVSPLDPRSMSGFIKGRGCLGDRAAYPRCSPACRLP